jgi:uncharacterized protein YutE (UPF0331/DUF86 family)
MIDPELVTRKLVLIARDLEAIRAPDFARRLAASAGLRNRIVHEYDELDQEKIFAALATALEHVPVYVRDVEQHLTRS